MDIYSFICIIELCLSRDDLFTRKLILIIFVNPILLNGGFLCHCNISISPYDGFVWGEVMNISVSKLGGLVANIQTILKVI